MLLFPAQTLSYFSFSEGPTKGLYVSLLLQYLTFNCLVASIVSQGYLNVITFSMTKYLLELPSSKCSVCDLLISLFRFYHLLILDSPAVLMLSGHHDATYLVWLPLPFPHSSTALKVSEPLSLKGN